MQYSEQRSFTIELSLCAEFPEGYEGDDDGYEWHQRFERVVRPKLAQAVVAAILADSGWRVTPVSRGHAESERLELRVERIVG